MNKMEALAALAGGKTLTHKCFDYDFWMKMTGSLYEFHDGWFCRPEKFWESRQSKNWNAGWKEYEHNIEYDE